MAVAEEVEQPAGRLDAARLVRVRVSVGAGAGAGVKIRARVSSTQLAVSSQSTPAGAAATRSKRRPSRLLAKPSVSPQSASSPCTTTTAGLPARRSATIGALTAPNPASEAVVMRSTPNWWTPSAERTCTVRSSSGASGRRATTWRLTGEVSCCIDRTRSPRTRRPPEPGRCRCASAVVARSLECGGYSVREENPGSPLLAKSVSCICFVSQCCWPLRGSQRHSVGRLRI